MAVLVSLARLVNSAEVPVSDDYNQWKQALGTNSATAAEHIVGLTGFRGELVRSAAPGEGSWVALAFDPRGRVVIAREDRGLLRLTLPTQANGGARLEVINTNLLECRGLLFAYDALYANANNSKGLYRLRDTDGDDQFDEIKLLKATPGGVGHGRNQLALGPDGMIYSIHGDDVGLPDEGVSANSSFKNYSEDRLLPCAWDKHLFNASARMPFGHVIRTDREGQTWELVAGGLRNPFGLAFSAAGDLFTYDADMEWDVGMPWYHPTRILHLVPGGDYGWRRGTGVLPVWSPETLPSVVDIGLGSPTAVQFGTRSNFPEPWRSALFVLDWAYGKIHAVHLRASGLSYAATTEVFLKGRPLNVTGLDFGPDGALYFVTGGRRTQSGLYRVGWTGKPGSPPGHRQDLISPKERSSVTSLTADRWSGSSPGDLEKLWPRLGDPDRWVRHSARMALESLPEAQWRPRALRETNPTAALTALLALTRVGVSNAAWQDPVYRRIHQLAAGQLTTEQQLLALRTLALCSIRLQKPNPEQTHHSLILWEPRFPTADDRVNRALCEWLVYLGSTNIVRQALPLLDLNTTQEEKLHYLFTLRLVRDGWTLPQRRTYVEWLGRARREFVGASMLPTAIQYIRAEVEASLSPAERSALADAFANLDRAVAPAAPTQPARPFVKEWTMADFANGWRKPVQTPESRERGARVFVEAGCAQCHRVGKTGGLIGPDLTAVGSRFDSRTILESILEPSKVIAELYRTVVLTTRGGSIVEGRIVGETASRLTLVTNPIDPEARREIAKTDIVSQKVSEVSSMPAGLLNTHQKEEIIQLLEWLVGGTAD
ncbi:MAG TPA: c-type cytochrome [Verrucomicrobiae bacterium]|nr:c-type cytochrome [Verrucomicrobiae bacterium]